MSPRRASGRKLIGALLPIILVIALAFVGLTAWLVYGATRPPRRPYLITPEGFRRLSDRGLKATFAVNGTACEVYEEACAAAREAGWEFMGHGFVQRPMHTVEDQSRAIADTIKLISDFTGKPVRGWESPGLTETDETIDLLAEAGIEYVADWVLDEQPVPIRTRAGEIVSVPYTVEVNDVVISAVQQQGSDEIFRRGRDQFDRLWQDGAAAPRVMAISIHPYLTGVPHRIKYLEALYDHILGHDGVVMWTGAEILDWYRGQVAGGP